MWAADYDLDVMAELADGRSRRLLVGECKWWKTSVGANVLRDLRPRAKLVGEQLGRETQLAIFSLSGFTDELRAAAKHGDVTLISAEELLRRP